MEKAANATTKWEQQVKQYREAHYLKTPRTHTKKDVEDAYKELKVLNDERTGHLSRRFPLAAAIKAMKQVWIDDGTWGDALKQSEFDRQRGLVEDLN